MRLPGLFLIAILIEIALFITLGGWMGIWLSFAVILGTAMLGLSILRLQGGRAAVELRQMTARMSDPAMPMARHMLIMLAAVLLILPGFMGDVVGLVLLIPPVQAALIAYMARRTTIRGARHPDARQAYRPDIVIDGEFIDLDAAGKNGDGKPGPRGPSGWTRH
ncbi:MAG: FxsA family protein [Gemmobacter sp.]|jgi:UPF0716 protein FxsA|nr:FxsA family protein [Gemmobacter sp.]